MISLTPPPLNPVDEVALEYARGMIRSIAAMHAKCHCIIAGKWLHTFSVPKMPFIGS